MLAGFLFLTACSSQDFSAAPGSVFQQCVQDRPEVTCQPSCDESGTCFEDYDYEINAEGQITDILLVVDNSGSMSEEQREMGDKFPNFLTKIMGLNYRIAMTTTDVSSAINLPDDNNGQGAYQDGRLLPLELNNSNTQHSLPYLDGSLTLAEEEAFFLGTITREETIACEDDNFRERSCPSGDERGLFASYLTIQNNPSDFIRPTGHMALVVLSDEDEGSNGSILDESKEDPQNFIDHFKERFPNKSFKAHAIIVEPDRQRGAACLETQGDDDGPDGQYGRVYAELTALTGGLTGNICAANYTNQLMAIGEAIAQQREVLPCRPIDNDVTISFTPQPSFTVNHTYDAEQNEILFDKALPRGTKIRFQFRCRNAE